MKSQLLGSRDSQSRRFPGTSSTRPRHAIRPSIFTLLALSLISSTTFAQSTWTLLGNGKGVDITSDGQFAVVQDINLFLWSSDGSLLDIGPEGALSVSTDGTTVLGNLTTDLGIHYGARWRQGSGWVQLPGLGGMSTVIASRALAMSADGAVSVGYASTLAGVTTACQWDGAGNVTALPLSGPHVSTSLTVSSDGTLIGGWENDSLGIRRAVFWDAALAQTFVTVSPTNPLGWGEVWGFSDNNEFAVGNTDKEGFLWSAAGGLIELGGLPAGDPIAFSHARDVSDDGETVVGYRRVGDWWDLRATIWTPATGNQELQSYLQATGATGVPHLVIAIATSPDGSKILAYGPEGWGIADLGISPTSNCSCDSASPCSNSTGPGEGCANSTGNGAVLAASGSSSVASDDLAFDCAQLPPAKTSLLFAGPNLVNGGIGTFFGDGLLCVSGNIERLGIVLSSATGNASFGAGLVGANGWMPGDLRNFQVWFRDPAGTCGSGFNTSNALQVPFWI